ncbi:MAG: response regulator transcription factor [Acidimicrobiia bacterium]|nr:response regulator transcription factor [Acidimicrobiia bacterium]
MTTILIIDDEAPLRRALRTSLRAREFEVVEASHGEEGVVLVADKSIDLVVLDLGLPDLEGVEVLERIRSFSEVPVVVLTARETQSDKVALLDAGADDYVSKPFDTEELLARIRAALRRTASSRPARPTRVEVDNLVIDVPRRLVTREGERIPLTRTEWSLLEVMVANSGRLLTHDFLLRKVWGPGYGTEWNYLRTYVGQLRKKLGDDAAKPRLIATEPGVGYRWLVDP